MADSEPTTVILHVNLGDASRYEEDIFPREYYTAGNALRKGSVLLSSTLDEMIKIAEMGIDLEKDRRFKFNVKAEFDRLATQEKKLKNHTKSFNPLTVFRNYRAARIFLSASKAFYRDTKETSERIQREETFVRVVPSNELSTIKDNAVHQNAEVEGIAITLPGPLDEDAKQKMFGALKAMALRAKTLDPFMNDLQIPQLSDGDSIMTLADTASLLSQDTIDSNQQQTDPASMSASPTYHLYFNNSVLAAGSSLPGMTLNQGDGNRGSNVTMTEQPEP